MNVHVSPLKMLVTLQPYKDPNGLYTVTEDLWVRNQTPNWKYVPVNSVFPSQRSQPLIEVRGALSAATQLTSRSCLNRGALLPHNMP